MPTYTDVYGVTITYYVWPVDAPRGIVQIAHGVGEHALRYAALAEALNAAGYTVYADDHRGHGQTGLGQHGGDHTRLGRLGVGGVRAAAAGVRQLSGIIRRAEPGLPLILLGHSWGSFLAQMIINEHAGEYDAVVLSGTAYRWPGYMDAGDLNRRHKKLGTTGMEWLSRDPAIAAAFVSDPLTTATPLAKLFGLREAARLFGRPARGLPTALPLLMLVGGDDTVGGERSAARLAEAYVARSGLRDVRLVVYPGARHEVFNETNRSEVIADLLHWLDEHLPVVPAAARDEKRTD
ncbi:alpha/beta fold hydrolase [Cryobacterium melibiosiphilum]|uniref:Alpha/beta fold hydrolase n=1 Tax=Cryobacterium melibiosiphilum TaxID=995039 RepID=A0A3A5MEU7_9MICO|nr:alpha/beta fold hydrolase [Cryobacterium melibiosiphilum]RJT87962.1 alpha/beta fold hydrolase [Cryobacterium melibiosiphilum]